MPTYYISPTGSLAADGRSEASPWTFARLMEHAPEPGDVIRLQSGATHVGSLEWFYLSDPDRPVTLGRYGELSKPNPVVVSGGRHGLWCAGSGLLVQGIDFHGDGGASGIEVTNAMDGQPSRNITIERVAASGYALAGIMLNASRPISDIRISRCRLSGNANGLFTSGAVDGVNMLRRVRVEDTIASDNNLLHTLSCGNGLCLVGVDDLEVIGCQVYRNGRMDGQGHSGITVQQCRRFRVAFCQSGNSLPGPYSDGQGTVCNSCDEGVVEYCESTNDNISFSVHDDRELVGPQYPSRRVVVRHNRAMGSTICYQVFRTVGQIHLHDNLGHTWARGEEYRKCVDVWDAGGTVAIRGNTFRADGSALLLEAAGPDGLRNVDLRGNDWQAQTPVWKVRDIYHHRVEDVLSVTPINL